MHDSASLLIFIAASLALLLTPGPAVLYIVARSLHEGRRAGLVSCLGIAVGTLLHIAAVTFGLAALVLSSAMAFAAVRYLGAAYLIYLGLRTLLARSDAAEDRASPPARRLRRIFFEGILVNATNPKAVLFFVAFLPQFVDLSRGEPQRQLLVLGLVFLVMALTTDSAFALAAGSLRGWLTRRGARLDRQRYLSGGVYLALGLATAVGGPPHK
jgi:threonine/homoserine/homoserine lactone efflux protein